MREAGVESSASERVGTGARVWVFEPCGVPSRPGASPPQRAPRLCPFRYRYAPFLTSARRWKYIVYRGSVVSVGVPGCNCGVASVRRSVTPRHLTIQRGYVAPACAYASRYFHFASC
jgi:hypothetical protein